MYEKEFKQIMDASEKNALTVFVGAGVSRLSGAPSWKELIEAFHDELNQSGDVSVDDYLRIPQIYYYSVKGNKEKYYSFIKSCFAGDELSPNDVHRMLFDLRPCSFITTNFDDLLEKAAIQCCMSYKTVACDNEVPEIYGDRYILKIHGDLEHENIILKEEDYLNYSENFKLIETLLKSIFSTNTVLMVGYSLNDYNIKLILNWAKVLLKDHFNKPIFIYTDDNKLSKDELTYHESRGLSVIEYYKCDVGAEAYEDFIERYKVVLRSIKNSHEEVAEGKKEEELFDILYLRLAPLDELWALKPSDLYSRLSDFVWVELSGTVRQKPDKADLFKYFLKLNAMGADERNTLPPETLKKYDTIVSVLSKSHVTLYHGFDKAKQTETIKLIGIELPFADELCLTFNYQGMLEVVKGTYASTRKNYKKAFYFARLNKFNEAYQLLKTVASNAYAENDLLLYYLAQTNAYCVFSAMKSISSGIVYYRYYPLFEERDIIDMSTERIERLFESLSQEFRRTYKCLEDLGSANILYKISYDSTNDARKLQRSIEMNTIEMGMTTTDKLIAGFNSNLHFLLGNGLYLDEYEEFKNTARGIMEQLIYKYSVQDQKMLFNSELREKFLSRVQFDYVDFYCFVEYFEAKELTRIFNKFDIKEIHFENPDKVYRSILNIVDYYDKVVSHSRERIEKYPYETRLKTCLALMSYISIPQEIVDRLCEVFLKYEFREIYIDDKILFLDRQILSRGMSSYNTAKTIENRLIKYMDEHIRAVEKGEDLRLFSTSSHISYSNLVHYIQPRPSQTRLAKRLNKILKIGIEKFPFDIYDNCYQYLSNNMKKKLVVDMKKSLQKHFDMRYFGFLAAVKSHIGKDIYDVLQAHLDDSLEAKDSSGGLFLWPSRDKYSDLIDVGCWYRMGLLPSGLFQKYLGCCDLFDFLYEYNNFDFSKFNVQWLLRLSDRVVAKICEEITVKEKLRSSVVAVIRDGSLEPGQEKKLYKVLITYLC